MTFIRPLILILPLLFLSACGSLESNEPKISHYVLNPAKVEKPAAPGKQFLIAVDNVRVKPGLDTPLISLIKDNRELDYFAGARWNARSDDMIRDFVAESLENHFGPIVIHPDDSRVHPKYVLQLDIRDFQAEYGPDTTKPPGVRIGMIAYIIDDETRTEMQRLKIEKTCVAKANTLAAVTATFESLMQQAAAEIIQKLAVQNIKVTEAKS